MSTSASKYVIIESSGENCLLFGFIVKKRKRLWMKVGTIRAKVKNLKERHCKL